MSEIESGEYLDPVSPVDPNEARSQVSDQNLSRLAINALRYLSGNRECDSCEQTFMLPRFDPRLVVVHTDFIHGFVTPKSTKQ